MTEPAAPERPDEPPGGRDAALRAAILRIGSSLDLDTVLAQVVESARALTGAAYGVIATADASGAPREFTLSGFSGDERRALLEWPDRHALFAHLRALAGPLRVPDLAAHIHALGFSAFPVPAGAFQATPMRHGETYVGGFFLGGREGGFTDADEETLVLFAQQAAAAIVNARAHRAERRARASLEALVETCPVGVVVLDATSGARIRSGRPSSSTSAGSATACRGRATRRGAAKGTVSDETAGESTTYRVVLNKSTQSSNANLSALTAKSGTDGSTFTALTLSPSTFGAYAAYSGSSAFLPIPFCPARKDVTDRCFSSHPGTTDVLSNSRWTNPKNTV